MKFEWRSHVLIPVLALALGLVATRAADAGYRGLTDEHMVGYINANRVITIDDGLGGHVQGMVRMLYKVAHANKKVVINGPCRSACTLFLSLSPSNVCLTPKAEMWFHQASLVNGKRSQFWTDAMIKLYPANIRNYVHSRGGLGRKWVVLKGKRLHRLFPSDCGQSPSTATASAALRTKRQAIQRTNPRATEARWWGKR